MTRGGALLVAGILALAMLLGILQGAQWDGALVARFAGHLAERPSAAMAPRFALQPAMAACFAWRDGREDARLGRALYFRRLMREPVHRAAALRDGLASVGRVMAIGFALDIVYQILAFGTVYPFEAAAMALVPFVAYLLLRGPFARLARWREGRR